jgi:septum site-determining protein MinD
MIRLCDDLRPDYDWILIDSPAGIERGFRNAVAPADIVLVITNPEVSAVRDADRIIGMIEAEEKGPARLVINRIKPGMVKRGEMLSVDDVLELLAIDLIGMVPDDDNIVTGANRGTPVVMDNKSKAGQAFNNIARRLNGEEVPFMKLDDEGSFLNRLARLFRSGGQNE